MQAPQDFLSSTLEEVALEGLDGITIQSLWIRLQNRPNFPIAIDENSQKFIWECIAVQKNVEIYELPTPRPIIKIYNRYDTIDSDLGIITEPKDPIEDIYPIEIVEAGDYRGSCNTFKMRKCVTSKIRHSNMLLMSLNQALDEWGDRLVLVASPKCRLTTLIGTESNPLIELTKEAYVILERIGRSRVHGETTHGYSGLLSLKSIATHLHYHLSKLHNKGLITKQKHYLKKKDGKCVTGFLFHLRPYFVLRKTKFDMILQMMADSLKAKPQNREISKVLRAELGLNSTTFKKVIYRCNQKWFKFVEVPYLEMHPDAPLEENISTGGNAKVEKVVQMIHPYDYDEANLENDESEDKSSPIYFDSTKVSIDKPIVCQVYQLIEKSGYNGLSLGDVMKELTLPRLDVRQLCRYLLRIKEVTTFMVDRGRQREEMYICSKFEKDSKPCLNIKEQSEKLKNSSNLVTETNDKETTKNQGNDLQEHKEEKDLSEEMKHINDSEDSKLKNAAIYQTINIKNKNYSSTSQLTVRILKRCNIIIEHVKKTKVATIFDLYRNVLEIEQNEGYNFKICRKSLFKLLVKLSKEGRIKIMKTTLKCDNKNKELELICDPSIKSNDENIQIAIEQAKFKLFGSETNTSKATKSSVNEAKMALETTKSIIHSIKELPVCSPRVYGTLPKFHRAKVLHLLFFYIVRDYEGNRVENSDDATFVFHNSDSWKRFIPPLPELKRKGWCTLTDIILRLPLSIFMKVVNITYEIPHIKEYLHDKEKQHYLLKHLPSELRSYLFHGRRYIFSIYDVVSNLCNMGLVSFGPKQNFKEKERVYVYVHQKIKIKDTTTSRPGNMHIDKNIEYKIKDYFFETLEDLENFWIDLENICNATPLGKYQKPEQTDDNTSQLDIVCENKEFDAVKDTGTLPGDGLGAGGLDSSLFGHLRRNWCWASQILKPIPKRFKNQSIASTTLKKLIDGTSEKKLPESHKKRLRHISKRSLNPSIKRPFTVNEEVSNNNAEEPPIKRKKVKNKRKGRIHKRPKSMKRKPYYDEKDQAALKLMEKLRTDWTAQEDSFLLICKATSIFLDSKCSRMVVPFTVIRDLLQEKFPQLSANKTSRACQRRLRFMLLNSDTRNSVSAFLVEAMQDAELVKDFDIIKPPKSNEKIWKTMFSNLCRRLLERISVKSTSSSVATLILPNNFKILQEQYKIICPTIRTQSGFKHFEPESLDDIYREVIHDLIMLALAAASDNKNWSYHLFRLYDQWPEILLKSIIDELSQEYVITRGTRRRISNIHVSHLPCRFSVTYENNFITKYPAVVFNGAKMFMEKLDIEESCHLMGDSPIGCTPVMLTLMFMNQMQLQIKVPPQLIVFNSLQNKKKMLNNMNNLGEDSEQLLRLCNITPSMLNDPKNSKESQLKKRKHHDNDDENFQVKIDKNSKVRKTEKHQLDNTEDTSTLDSHNLNVFLNNVNVESNEVTNSKTSRLALNMLRQENSMPKIEQFEHCHDCIALNSCEVLCLKKTTAKNSIPFILNPWKIVDDVSITSCDLNTISHENLLDQKFVNEIIKSFITFVPQKIFSLEDFSSLLRETYKMHTNEIERNGEEIFNFISKYKITGVSHNELWLKFKNLTEFSIHDHLTLLLKSQLIIRVGTLSFRFVCVKYSKPWLLCSPGVKPTDSKRQFLNVSQNYENEIHDLLDSIVSKCEEKTESPESLSGSAIDTNLISVDNCSLNKRLDSCHKKNSPDYFLPRVWRMPDGSLNKLSFIKYLQTILSFILSSPGISEANVCERFLYILSPIQTLELLDMLVKFKCIFKYYVKHFKTSTFAPIKNSYITKDPEPEDEPHYEPFVDAILKILTLEKTVLNSNIL